MRLRALITGSAGFTGLHLREALHQEGIDVYPLTCDVMDQQALRTEIDEIQPDWVIHLAAKSFVADEDLIGFYRVNVLGTENVLHVLSTMPKPPSRVLIASSANVYGTPALSCIDESVAPGPVNHYALSKLAMEYMVKTWFDKLPIIITRPFNYTGPGQDERFIIPKIVAHYAKRAQNIELGNIGVSRDFSDVRDVVRSYIALLRSSVRSRVVNVCRGVATPLSDIIQIMNDLSGYKMNVYVNPAFVRSNEILSLCGDNSFLKSLIHIVPSIPIHQTLEHMYNMSQKS